MQTQVHTKSTKGADDRGHRGATNHDPGRSGDIVLKAITEHGEAIKEFREEVEAKQSEFSVELREVQQHVAQAIKSIGTRSDAGTGRAIDVKSLVESEAFQRIKSGNRGTACGFELGEVSIKAMVNGGGDPSSVNTVFSNPAQPLPHQLGQPLKPLRFLDVLTPIPVDRNSIEFTRLTWTGDADTQVEEADEKAEIEGEGEPVTAYVETIAVHTTASAQILDDVDQLQNTIDRVLTNSVAAKIESQLIVGSGTLNRIEGLYTLASTLATEANSAAEKIGQALMRLETLGYVPDTIVLNPEDWFAIQTTKDADGNFIYGNPASPAPPTLWNRRVITLASVPAGTALVGDTKQCALLDRMQPTLFISRDHKDYRTRNLVLLLVEARVGLQTFDTGAWRKVQLEPVSQ
ncbi:phage major capsid protein [Dokdonella immobilis]|uniref:Phage major capsid protein, HK97 family n=1 Tax=Dokdonella immobilis TaxID=578942 RepID=A0A1I4VV54_9GAMM|nr:phage major capsid protein [Dokdonella immobilis]SFN05083.1 phage major capsid protein, HK97 family [Dokdonella immobilis]